MINLSKQEIKKLDKELLRQVHQLLAMDGRDMDINIKKRGDNLKVSNSPHTIRFRSLKK